MITLNKKLNLVIPITRADNTVLYVHSTPLLPETFERYHLVLAKTFSSFAQNGLDPRSGPSVAAMILRDVAEATPRLSGMNWWEGPDGVGGESGLLAEFVRLSNAIVPAAQGWGSVPLATALHQNLIDDEEKREVMSLLAFFMVVSTVAPRVDRPRLVQGMAAIYELQTTLSNATEYASSLRTSTTDESTGVKSAA